MKRERERERERERKREKCRGPLLLKVSDRTIPRLAEAVTFLPGNVLQRHGSLINDDERLYRSGGKCI